MTVFVTYVTCPPGLELLELNQAQSKSNEMRLSFASGLGRCLVVWVLWRIDYTGTLVLPLRFGLLH